MAQATEMTNAQIERRLKWLDKKIAEIGDLPATRDAIQRYDALVNESRTLAAELLARHRRLTGELARGTNAFKVTRP